MREKMGSERAFRLPGKELSKHKRMMKVRTPVRFLAQGHHFFSHPESGGFF